MNRPSNPKDYRTEMSLVFVGHAGTGSNALSLFKGLRKNVAKSQIVDTQFFDTPPRISLRRIFRRVIPNAYGKVASIFLDLIIMKIVRKNNPNIFFVFKGNYVGKRTLARIKATKVHYHPDDSSNKLNRTSIFEKSEIAYDLHFTSKKHNIREIESRTGKKVYFVWYAFDTDWHFRAGPLDFQNPRFAVGFIGHMRKDRIDLLSNIAQHLGTKLAIAGINWNRIPILRNKATLLPAAFGRNFSEFIAQAPVQLGLLNSDNRDQHTARSFEVPAAGGLLVAEDTPDHREIFGTDGNVLFFKDEKDLLNKLEWVKNHPNEASEIAENGFKHITMNGNSWQDRSVEILSVLDPFIKKSN